MLKKLFSLLLVLCVMFAQPITPVFASSDHEESDHDDDDEGDDDHDDDDDDDHDDGEHEDEDEEESGDGATRYLVTSVGTVGGVTRTASAEILAPDTSTAPTINYAIAGGSSSSHVLDSGTSSSPGAINGNIYMAGPITLDGPTTGGSLVVTGNVTSLSTVTVNASASVSGTVSQNAATTGIFPSVDFTYYQAIAAANGFYFSTNKTYASGTIPASPAGGVIYVNGNLTIQGTQSTTACIIATGSITISKTGSTYPQVTITKFSNYPVLMTQSGAITFTTTGSGTAYLRATGLIYSGNNFAVTAGNHGELTVVGGILARGTINTGGMTSSNSLSVTYAEGIPAAFTDTEGSTASIRSYNS